MQNCMREWSAPPLHRNNKRGHITKNKKTMSKKNNKPFSVKLSMSEGAAVIDVAGVIGWDTDAMQFNDLVDEAKNAGARELVVRINSVGGYCYDGLSMGDKLRTCGMHTRGEVHGCAMSMASYLLQCCEERVAHRNATLMFHQPSACICGTVDEMLQEATYLVGMRDRMFEQMGKRVGKTGAELSAEHMTTKYYTAEQALEYGFLDKLAGETEEAVKTEVEAEPEEVTACRVFAYDLGVRVAMMAEETEEEPEEPVEEPEEEDGEEEPQEPAEEPDKREEIEDTPEADNEQEDGKEEQEEAIPEERIEMTRSQLEELVARRAAEKVAAMGVTPEALGVGAVMVRGTEAGYSRAELDAMPAMVRLRVLRENPSLAARYM